MFLPTTRLLVSVLVCVQCARAISVPASWDQPSYFEYPATKSPLSVDVARQHSVSSPHRQFRTRPVPVLTPPGVGPPPAHSARLLAPPAVTQYQVFHPYQAEQPALRELYRDPALHKVRTDLELNKQRLQQHEHDSGILQEPDFHKKPKQVDLELFPLYRPPALETHNAENTAVYYAPPPRLRLPHSELNTRLKSPLRRDPAKIKPAQYEPLRAHLSGLRSRQQHKYGDERNEYPQKERNFAEPPSDGYDIYEEGDKLFKNYRHQVDDALDDYNNQYSSMTSTNEQPSKSDSDNPSHSNEHDSDEENFVPIKMYAQVRKSSSYKHLPKQSAYDEAETPEELINAPRLREAVKSTKAQTVYTEEGYEDKAYDHAGQQKHASNHENHGGFLKENQGSNGRYRIPYVEYDVNDGESESKGNSFIHNDEYSNANEKLEEIDDSAHSAEDDAESDIEDITSEDNINSNIGVEENRQPQSIYSVINKSENVIIQNKNSADQNINDQIKKIRMRNKRQNDLSSFFLIDSYTPSPTSNFSKYKTKEIISKRNKRETTFIIPRFNLRNTYITEEELKSANQYFKKYKRDNIKSNKKYPYYSNTWLNNDSPLRYAENMEAIPLKSRGGTEFYDSRSIIKCQEIEPNLDPIPEKIKSGSVSDNTESDSNGTSENNVEDQRKLNKREAEYNESSGPRLEGLGDKIDCFKEKYFGSNPLDSPFFYEHAIENPKPFKEIESEIFELEENYDKNIILDNLSNETDKSYSGNNLHQTLPLIVSSTNKSEKIHYSTLPKYQVYSDVVQNIQRELSSSLTNLNETDKIGSILLTKSTPFLNKINSNKYNVYTKAEDVQLQYIPIRHKRTANYLYDPYKVVRENIDPRNSLFGFSNLLKIHQLSVKGNDFNYNPRRHVVKRNTRERSYKNIKREDRTKTTEKTNDRDFIDVKSNNQKEEPRHEIVHSNHKNKYSPVSNTRAISLEEYQAQLHPRRLNKNKNNIKSGKKENEDSTNETPTFEEKLNSEPYFDVSAYIPDLKNPQLKEKIEYSVKNADKSRRVENSAQKDKESTQFQLSTLKNLKKRVSQKYNDDRDEKDDQKDIIDDEDEYTSTSSRTTKAESDSEDKHYEDYVEESDELIQTTLKPSTRSTSTTTTSSTTTSTPIKITTTKVLHIPKRRVATKLTNNTTEALPTIKSYHYDYEDQGEQEENDDSAQKYPSTTLATQTTTLTTQSRKIKNTERNHSYDKGRQSENNKSRRIQVIKKRIHKPIVSESAVKSEKSTIITDSKSYGDDHDLDVSKKDEIDSMVGVNDKEGKKRVLTEFLNDYEDSEQISGQLSQAEESFPPSYQSGEILKESKEESSYSSQAQGSNHKTESADYKEDERGESEETNDSNEEEPAQTPPPPRSTPRRPVARKKVKIKKNHKPNPHKELDRYHEEARAHGMAADVNKLVERQEKAPLDVEVFEEEAVRHSPRHGGNYRSAPAADTPPAPAALLSSLARAAPALASPPRFILDPGRRKYYYVD